MNLHEVLNLAKQLSPVDKVRLIQQLTFDLEADFRDRPPAPQHHPHQPPQQANWDMSGDMRPRPSAPDIDPGRWEDLASFPD